MIKIVRKHLHELVIPATASNFVSDNDVAARECDDAFSDCSWESGWPGAVISLLVTSELKVESVVI